MEDLSKSGRMACFTFLHICFVMLLEAVVCKRVIGQANWASGSKQEKNKQHMNTM